jgi:serine phosphatase RsbU (regulator of sigma subunit)
MRKVVKALLAQNANDEFSVSDGMDMTIGIIDPETRLMKFASANQTAIIVRNGATIKIKGDRMPIGNYTIEEDFQDFEIQLQKGDALYFMSDGIKDQTNPDREKYKSRRLEAFMIENDPLPMNEIGKRLKSTIEAWRGGSEQVDDMTMVGVRIS